MTVNSSALMLAAVVSELRNLLLTNLKLWRVFVLSGLVLFLTACASNSLFIPYPSRMAEPLEKVARGEPVSEKELSRRGPDALLHFLEAGRMAHIQGRYPRSVEYFEQAIAIMEAHRQEALVDVSEVGKQGAALLVNDNAITYRGAFYEQSLAHLYQAMNFLFLGNLEAAGVEVRRANLIDQDAMNRHEARLAKAQQAGDADNGVAPGDFSAVRQTLDERFFAMREKAANIKSTFVSAYGYYLSGLIYELRGEFNDAYIDYKKALELDRDNPLLQRLVLRWATNLGFTEDLAYLEEVVASHTLPAGHGEVIVLYEQGFVPPKQEIAIPFLRRRGALLMLAFPAYERFSQSRSLRIGIEGGSEDQPPRWTRPLTDVQALAAKTLRDQQLMMLGRQIARAFTKAELQYQLEKQGGILGTIVGNVYNVVSERADLRSWLSLPAYAHGERFSLPKGDYELIFSVPDYAAGKSISLRVDAGTKTVIQVIGLPAELYINKVSY